jgi:hypothetical protein
VPPILARSRIAPARATVSLALAFAVVASAARGAAPSAVSPPAFPLKVDPSGRFLVDQRGSPFLVHGDTPWSLTHNLTFEEAVRYLEDRRARGFDALLVSAPDAYDPDGKATYSPDRYGHQPFEDGDWTRPVEAYWAHVDRVLRLTEEMGFLVLFAPAYLGCCGDGYEAQVAKNGETRALAYGRWIGRRYAGLTNLVWVHGGDRNPFIVEKEVRAIARGIRESGAPQMQTAHWASGTSGLDHLADVLDFNTSYTYGPVAWRVLHDRAAHPQRPTILVETHYENDFGRKTAEDVRAYPYRALLSGAAGDMFGNKPAWYCGRGWESALARPGSRYMEIARRFFDSRDWWALEPDITHDVVVDGRGDPGGDDGAQVAVTRGGDLLVAYLPSRLTLTVRLDRLSGPELRGHWFDPRTGTATSIGTMPRAGVRAFSPPADGDWLLVLDDASKDRPAPGAAARTASHVAARR